jgi:hypothetical protein
MAQNLLNKNLEKPYCFKDFSRTEKIILFMRVTSYLIAVIGIIFLIWYAKHPCNCEAFCNLKMAGPQIPINWSLVK